MLLPVEALRTASSTSVSAKWRATCDVGCIQARVFQSSKCALTGAPLELPAVHFLCGHAFNLRSLGENDRDCPLCAPQFRAILDIRNSLRAGAAEQASFA